MGTVLEPMIPGDLDDRQVFAMIVEEDRRDRARRVAAGDADAKLKIQSTAAQAAANLIGKSAAEAAEVGQKASQIPAGGLQGILAARQAAMAAKATATSATSAVRPAAAAAPVAAAPVASAWGMPGAMGMGMGMNPMAMMWGAGDGWSPY